MALEIQAPDDFSGSLDSNKILIFTGGSIEMGTAKQWQKQVVTSFSDYPDVVILNPRRNAWDSKLKQTKETQAFREQVEWELSALEESNIIIMYFDPDTKSPVSLLETGLFSNALDRVSDLPKLHVICPDG